MPQSLSNILLHVVFSTRNRQPFITSEVRPRLHAYLATVVRNMDMEYYRVGGVEDHVHLAIRLSRTVDPAKLVEKIKSSSSAWMKDFGPEFAQFTWQRGYGVFSLRATDREELCRYIDGQAEHHRKVTFQEEYRALLKEFGIEYDERYMWD